jgi:histidyl-tRNA synthetase
MENLDTLMGKYGEEGDKLIFKILNNGLDKPDKEKQAREDFEKVLQGKSVKGLTERALKYDLTIPFARYVAMNHGQLNFPFKRYQIQPVWRADRPQRGRYREFYQCDADVVGSKALLNEIELVNIYASVFDQLKITVVIKVNSRKILQALAEAAGGAERMIDITTAIDKLDKIGLDKVKEELASKKINAEHISIIERYLLIAQKGGNNKEVLEELAGLFGQSNIGNEGMNELETILAGTTTVPGNTVIRIDPSLARGLNYYTGSIFEVSAVDVKMGSIGGGGRYDDLTGLFGVPGIPGVGISFGVDRIYDVMEELNLFPKEVFVSTQVLFFNLGEAESRCAFMLLQELRSKGISGELFHEQVKFDKQFKYAEKKNIPFVIIIGEKELENNTCTIKNLNTGVQETINMNALPNYKF